MLRRQRTDLFDIINISLMLLLIVIMTYPFLNVIALSLSSSDHIMIGAVTVVPKGFNLNSYKVVFQDSVIWRSYLNTIFYAAGATFFMLFFTSVAAYPLSIKEFKGRGPITVVLAITMFFYGGLIPTYLWMKTIGFIDTYWVMVLPGSISAFTVIIFRTFFQTLGTELRESARMDGANEFVVLFRIFVPLSKALLATFGLFSIVGTWNSWFEALIYLKDPVKYPLQLILRRYLFNPLGPDAQASVMESKYLIEMMRSLRINPKSVQMAVIIVAMLPITFIYPFLQKYFVKGVMIGAIKG